MFFWDPRSGIRDGKKSGSGINIPDPQHWYLVRIRFPICGYMKRKNMNHCMLKTELS
jgi:hypothetical protein